MQLRKSSLGFASGSFLFFAAAGVSFGAAAGKPNLSGNLTKVAQPVKNQKLLADPSGAIEGSISIVYDSSVATLTQVFAEAETGRILPSPLQYSAAAPGYYLDKVVVDGFAANGTTPEDVTIKFNSASSDPNMQGLKWVPTASQLPAIQSGFVQVFWSDLAPDGSGNLPNLDNPTIYNNAKAAMPDTTAETNNAAGDNNTYAAFFGPTTNDPNAIAQYLVYADPSTDAGGQFGTPDEYTALLDDGSTITYTAGEINPAEVQGTFAPEPSSLAIIGIGTAMMLRRRRSTLA